MNFKAYVWNLAERIAHSHLRAQGYQVDPDQDKLTLVCMSCKARLVHPNDMTSHKCPAPGPQAQVS